MDSRERWSAGLSRRIVLGLALAVCAAGPAGAVASFDGQGRITAVDPGRSTVTIEHGGIPGLLPATQSEFPVQGVIQGVRPGDRVRFTLGAMDESHGLLTIVSLTPEQAVATGWLDRVLMSAAAALALVALAAAAAIGVLLWRELRAFQRRMVALDHEVGMLRGLVTDTQDGVRQIARALDDAATALRVGYVQQLRRHLVPNAAPARPAATGDPEPGETAAALVVVQRGRGDLYHAVAGGKAGPDLAVIWDRRRSERRRAARRPSGHERRRTERRGSPAETWTRLGFHLVPGGAVEGARAPRALRPASGERGAGR
jgi:uncharacterized protein YndB with AHSA1/START domain